MTPRPWDRKLWGVACDGGTTAKDHPILIGELWSERPAISGAPTRALLFVSRADARKWVKAQPGGYWASKLRPVRVR